MNHYDILGISKTSTNEDIRKAYKTKSKKLHPDKGGTKEDFVKLNDSYNFLIDENKRKIYDQNLSNSSNFTQPKNEFKQPNFTQPQQPSNFTQPSNFPKTQQPTSWNEFKRFKRWTKDEENLLLTKLNEGKNINQISLEMKRTVGAIKIRIAKLKKEGIMFDKDKTKEEKKTKEWTEEDNKLLLSKLSEKKDIYTICSEMERTQIFIKAKIKIIKTNWTKEDEKILKEKVNEVKDIGMIAEEMNKLKSQIKSKMKELNLKLLIDREKGKGRWTKEEENLLLEKYNNDIPMGTICEQMGRSVSALKSRLKKILKGQGN